MYSGFRRRVCYCGLARDCQDIHMCIPAVFTYCLMEEVADYGFCYNFGGGDSYSVYCCSYKING